jgi:LuxR family transcriptional regulator, activator of conjugal transfer of Ti plasmids
LVTRLEIVFQNFVDELWTACDGSALHHAAERVASELGFENFAYLGLHESHTVWISNYPRDWISRYFERGYERIDPVVSLAKTHRRAFAWTGEDWRSHRNKSVRGLFNEAHDFHIETGITVPIASGFDSTAAITFATQSATADLYKRLTDARDFLELVGLYFHAHIDLKVKNAQPSQKSHPLLSQRETQCLEWAARGKTTAEVAEIISLSSRTVTFHLENARRKLDASNITQAVAIALRCNLIH